MQTSESMLRLLGVRDADRWLKPLNAAMAKYKIDTVQRVAAFLAQALHESAMLTRLSENLNYSADGLVATFPKYFTHEQAVAYARQPKRIANRAYANRMGNGDEASGDGWNYRGKGPLQITGKDNHAACGKELGIDLVSAPELLLLPDYGCLSAGWYWTSHGLNELADYDKFDSICDIINIGHPTKQVGDSIGYAERVRLYKAASNYA